MMEWILWGLTVIAAIFAVFFVGPVVAAYCAIFARKRPVPLDKADLTHTYFEPHLEKIRQGLGEYDSIPFEKVQITAHDGVHLVADFCPGTLGRTAIFFHGYNACPRNNFFRQAAEFHALGYDLVMVCQRGHGESGGKRTFFGMAEGRDVLAWTAWAAQQLGHPILLYGTSMGAASVAYGAAELKKPPVRAMVLDSGFLCPCDMILSESEKRSALFRLMVPAIGLLMKLLHGMDLRSKNTLCLQKTEIPALFLCSYTDKTVPASHVEEAYACCASEKELVYVADAPHTLAYLLGGEEVKTRLAAFLSRHFTQEEGNVL